MASSKNTLHLLQLLPCAPKTTKKSVFGMLAMSYLQVRRHDFLRRGVAAKTLMDTHCLGVSPECFQHSLQSASKVPIQPPGATSRVLQPEQKTPLEMANAVSRKRLEHQKLLLFGTKFLVFWLFCGFRQRDLQLKLIVTRLREGG